MPLQRPRGDKPEVLPAHGEGRNQENPSKVELEPAAPRGFTLCGIIRFLIKPL